MNDAPVELNYEVIKHGKVLHIKDQGEKVDVESTILSRCLDRRYYEQRSLKEFLEKIIEERRIMKESEKILTKLRNMKKYVDFLKSYRDTPKGKLNEDYMLRSAIERNFQLASTSSRKTSKFIRKAYLGAVGFSRETKKN